MILSGIYRFDAPQDAVWELLMDPDAIAKAIPGVDAFVTINGESNAWNARLNVNLAAVKGQYMGSIRMSELDAPRQFRLTVNGEGQQSIIGGSVLMQLDYDAAEALTVLTWDADANISGKLARVGQRVIKAAASMMSNRFFQSLEDQMKIEEK
jgi:carbon monoxide dehydrogenase subunit G